ncbi:GNAT family protein [Klebsiella pneumoniae]|uniref:GNAT family N-acetyltransferase n=1 Tax=Klebsiella pneumoniae TaxID=573 RepID=UPI000DF0D2AB|nr:GNAT family protein [Klebsiella pneumoniae]MDK6675910.1 GNAT family protein [Klebsiella pneumoniae]MDK8101922.1 GNAT family protein [Klebsiella pneumoniae]
MSYLEIQLLSGVSGGYINAAALFNYLSSPRTPCFKDEKLHSLAEAEVDVAKRASDPTQFAVCLKETDTLIGHLFADNSNEPDNNTWSVGWHFNQRFEHQGYASESVAALFDYLFKVKGARRLYAWVEDYNYSSQKLCERLLMRREGCFKEFVSFENEEGKARYDDTYIYALLHKEWTK